MEPHRSFSNSIVKGYSGDDTEGEALWENNTVSKFFLLYCNCKYLNLNKYTMAIAYAIVQSSGKQFWIEENRFYDFNKLPLNSGDTFNLNKILLINKHGYVQIGKPFISNDWIVNATVVRHLQGSKIRVYKMRSKKKTRKTFGSRPKLTRIFVNSIIQTAKTKAICYL